MSYAPKHIADLRAAWVKAGGVDLGIVGDSAHPSGYHVGRDRIYSPTGQGDADYSVQQPRDRDGLTNAASAFDYGHDDLATLRAYSNWLVAYCQSRGPGSEWVREVIYSPDGAVVQRWSGVDGRIHPGWPTATGNGDASHLAHTHLSLFRDAEAAKADLTPLVTAWATLPPDTSTEDPTVSPYFTVETSTTGLLVDLPVNASVFDAAEVSDAHLRRKCPTPETWLTVGWVVGTDGNRYMCRVGGDGVFEFVLASEIGQPYASRPAKSTLATTSAPDGQSVVVSIA